MCTFFQTEQESTSGSCTATDVGDYLQRTGRKRCDKIKLMLWALSTEKLFPTHHCSVGIWNMGQHSRKTTTIDYKQTNIFTQFVEQITESGSTEDVQKFTALPAELFKLLGKSAYGKIIEALEHQTNAIQTKEERGMHKALAKRILQGSR